MEKSPWSGWIRALGLFTTVIAEIGFGTIAGVLLGYAGVKFLRLPDFTMLFTGMTGFGIGLYRVYLASQKLSEDSENGSDE